MNENLRTYEEFSKVKTFDREREISKYWDEIDLLRLCVTERDPKNKYVFYEGPPTANGRPGIHHVMARTLKDLTCRYKTMKGYQVKRKAGWDTHGLPVEIEVEKKLGLKDKHEIVDYGIEAFNKECRESVFVYEKLWREMSEDMAYLVDLDDPYITLENEYIESCWHILDSMYKDDMLYEGHKILPYCARCGTGLASHEVAQGYEEIKTESVTVRFKRKDSDEYFLAWTTTPWTLPSNVSLTVNPEVDYIKAKADDGKVYYVAKALAEKNLGEDFEVLETMKGKNLEHIEYEQLIPMIKTNKKAFFVTLADYVTIDDGTGIVHTAPAFGEDDYNTGTRYDLPVVNPVNDDGKFTETDWEGMFVMDADPEIIKWLKEQGLLVRKYKIDHNYPHCWRCRTPLLYYAKPSWYIEMTKIKDQLVENNNNVNWFPEFVGEKRFGNWLENLQDWAISRSRYWGTPLPLWRCEECGKVESVGSIKELVDRAIEDIDENIELHRPYVDDVHFECSCGGRMTREPEVIDVWFDSGAMPFAQWHYPFEHKEDFDQLFPADFICEGIDQTRGWFYSLMAISTYMTGKSPYKNVLVNDLVLDKDGKKMSKSRGNTVDPFDLFEEYGADVLRWYLIYVSPPWIPTKFDEDGLKEVESKFFRSIKNIYNFFSLYTGTEKIDPSSYDLNRDALEEIDKWLLSKYHNLLDSASKNMDIFELTKVVRDISDFVIEDFSNWYIRRTRRRFWQKEENENKKVAFKVVYEVLLGVAKLIAPFTPFIAEDLYRKLTDGVSVHIEYYPEADTSFIEPEIEERMDLVRTLVTLGRASREKVQLKVRQPLSEILIDGRYEEKIKDLTPLLMEELNVKEVVFEKNIASFMDYSLKPDFKEAGKILGGKIKAFQKVLNEVDPKEFMDKLEKEGKLTLKLDGEDTEILREYIDLRISAKEGFDVQMENGVFLILDTKLDQALIDEGYVREFISKIQNMRKTTGLEVMDRIKIAYKGTEAIEKAVGEYKDIIMNETLADSLEVKEVQGEEFDLNGEITKIGIEKV